MEVIRKVILAVLLITPCLLYAESININTADKATLIALKGIGEKRAEAIIAYREQYGPFKTVDELAEISGIGQSIVNDLRENISVESTSITNNQ